ncbi:MAG: DUF4388 domain-containing protein [Acidobacteriota bacterium]
MPLSGNLRTMPFADLMQWLAMSHKTGTLVVRGRQFTKRIFFSQGAVCAVASDNPRERLGYFLVGWNYLDEGQLRVLLEEQGQQQRALGELAVQHGLVPPEELQRLLRVRAEEVIFDLMLWEEGDFRFLDDNLPTRLFRELTLSVDHFLLEGARRLDEARRMAAIIPSSQHIPRLARTIKRSALQPAQLALLDKIDGVRSIEQIALECRLPEIEILRFVFKGVQQGAFAILPPSGEPLPIPGVVEDGWSETLREAETSLSLGDLVQAYELLSRVRRNYPKVPEALEKALELEVRIRSLIENTAASRDVILELAVDLNQATHLRFSPEEAFVLSRVNGRYTLPQVLALFPGEKLLGRLIVYSLLQQGILKFRESQAIEKLHRR